MRRRRRRDTERRDDARVHHERPSETARARARRTRAARAQGWGRGRRRRRRSTRTLAGVELRAARRELDHDGRVVLARGLEARVDAARRHAVDRRNREALVLRGVEQVHHRLAGQHARVHARRQLRILADRAIVGARQTHIFGCRARARGRRRPTRRRRRETQRGRDSERQHQSASHPRCIASSTEWTSHELESSEVVRADAAGRLLEHSRPEARSALRALLRRRSGPRASPRALSSASRRSRALASTIDGAHIRSVTHSLAVPPPRRDSAARSEGGRRRRGAFVSHGARR